MKFSQFTLTEYKDCLVVTDEKIAKLYGISGDNVYLLPQGEVAKSFAYVESLCHWFLQKNLSKDGKVVAVGGGSVGDTVGFACSVYKRGVALLHVPTTLLAMVDSAIGGKTALDIGQTKNAVGTFYPAETLIDFNFLKTLDNQQTVNGLGEILKYRMLDEGVNEIAKGGDIHKTIVACANYKQAICNVDTFDKGIRKKLNFGHTIGHAMELTLGISHGLAVLNGIYYETILAYNLGLCSQDYMEYWTKQVQKIVNVCPMLTNSMLDMTIHDKKNQCLQVGFVLPDSFDFTLLPLNKVKQLLLDD